MNNENVNMEDMINEEAENVEETEGQESEQQTTGSEATEETNGASTENIQIVEEIGYAEEEKHIFVPEERQESLPSGIKAIKNKNGVFIETVGQGWIPLTEGQVNKLISIIKG